MRLLSLLLIGIFSIPIASSQTDQKVITVGEAIASRTFYPKRVSGIRSMKDGIHYTSLKRERNRTLILKYSYAEDKTADTILNSEAFEELSNFSSYFWNADENMLLIATDEKPLYRYSFEARYFIINLDSQKIIPVTDYKNLKYTEFSPNSDKVAFVRENNLYYFDIAAQTEVQMTNDGKSNKIINGGTDWVHEEEFGFDRAFEWSPDGKKICYYKFDESDVKEYSFPVYGNQIYSTEYRYKYPKAGEDNASVGLYIYNLETRSSTQLDIPHKEYYPRIKWIDAKTLAVQSLNRLQNQLEIYSYNVDNQTYKNIYSESSETYVDVIEEWYFAKEMLMLTSEKSGYRHIYIIDLIQGKERAVTTGEWEVSSFYGYDEKSGTLYYQAALPTPMDRTLYSQKIGKKKVLISKEKGWSEANFSKGFQYFISTWSDANTPHTSSVNNSKGKRVRKIMENNELKETIAEYGFRKKEFFTFKNDEGDQLNGWIIKPLDAEYGDKVPVLLTIYGGPGSQTVENRWSGMIAWHQLLAQNGYAVASVDNRGTGGRGADFKKSTYKNLGKLELEDYISFAKFLKTQSWADPTRIGIWGWSYGGYMSSLAITKGHDYFKAAVAIAPVTNWRYYDNIYTERFMQTPQKNGRGYDDNSPVNFVEQMKGKYLLVHGTADDNVHFQNTTEMIDALVRSDKQFELYIYPDKNHGIYGGNTRKHLFQKVTDFLYLNL
jgi:dipeptidyl-peptidase-4